MKIAIIGSKDVILGFKAVGVKPFGIDTAEEGVKIINNLRKSAEYGIVLITEDWAEKLMPELQTLQTGELPAVITIPSSRGTTGEGLKGLRRIVERAVGSDVLK